MKGILRSLGVALGGLIEREQSFGDEKAVGPVPFPVVAAHGDAAASCSCTTLPPAGPCTMRSISAASRRSASAFS